MFKILKPAMPGVTVRDPITRRNLPDEGRAVTMSSFWRRRLADGSVIEVTSTPAPVPEISSPGNLEEIRPYRKKIIGTVEKKINQNTKELNNGLTE